MSKINQKEKQLWQYTVRSAIQPVLLHLSLQPSSSEQLNHIHASYWFLSVILSEKGCSCN